jgi:hypothetical protein
MIKVLNGKVDAHTRDSNMTNKFPVNFRIFDDEVLVNYPKEEKGSKLISINGVPIKTILEELDNINTYGTEEKRIFDLETSLFRINQISCIPSLRQYDTLTYEFESLDGQRYTKEFDINQKEFPNNFSSQEFRTGNPGTYEIRNNTLIINHTSVGNQFKDLLEERYKIIQSLDLTNIDRIIVDIRINEGGNSELNNYLYDFLDAHKDKELIVLTGYRVFSSGRWCLRGLLDRNAISIGERISTPMNCCGNNERITIDGNTFSIASKYFHPTLDKSATSKEEFKKKFTADDVENLDIFEPDIYVTQSKEDFINDKNTILEYALNYKKENKKTHH